MRRILIPALIASVGLTGPALADGNVLTLSGTGSAEAAPDLAIVTSGVTTQGETARAALDANSAAMASLLKVLKEGGIAPRDIQTSGFSVSPNYVYSDGRDPNGYSLPPQISGYQVSNNVTATIRDLDALGPLLDKAVTVGANTINGISFSLADPSAALDTAREAAFADARHKAELYARLMGRTLGPVESLTETEFPQPPQPMMMRVAAEAAPAVPVASGTMSYSATVSVTWSLLP